MEWNVDPKSDTPVFKQIKNCIKAAIEHGELTTDDQLPSVREIAQSCDVNPNTAARALRELQLEGIVYARRGSGVFVADPAKADEAEELITVFEENDPGFDEASESLTYEATGRALARVFSHLDLARSEAESAGLDWMAILNLFNSSSCVDSHGDRE